MFNTNNERILVLIKRVREQPKAEWLPNNFAIFNKVVKGKFKIIPYSNKRCNEIEFSNIYCIVNEEEETSNLPSNFITGDRIVYGTAIFVSKAINGKITGLTDSQMNLIFKIYDYNRV